MLEIHCHPPVNDSEVRKQIKYIGFYDTFSPVAKRVGSIAATNKMDYVCETLVSAGYDVHVISPAWANHACTGWLKSESTSLGAHKKLTLCASMRTNGKVLRNAVILITLLWLTITLLLHVRRGETVLVYHSPWLSWPVRIAKWIKGCRVILEVEEIYAQVWQLNDTLKAWEASLIASANSYLAVSSVLASRLPDKPKVVVYGNYTVYESKAQSPSNPTVRLVYAGSIDYTKGGAFNAIACLEFLPKNYILHVCGHGEGPAIADFEKQVAACNSRLDRRACVFHGVVSPRILTELLQASDIAINPQSDGENMTTIFPSKLLKYLCHNLRVVTTRIESIANSPFSTLVVFSRSSQPDDFANAVRLVNLSEPFDSVVLLTDLNRKFIKELKFVVEGSK